MVYAKEGYVSAVPGLTSSCVISETTDWLGANVERSGSSFALAFKRHIPAVAIMISAGVQYGIAAESKVEVVKYFGAGKVLMVWVGN